MTACAQTELFGDLSEAEATVLATFLERVEHQPGDVIVRQGDPSDAVYFLESGKVEVRATGPGGTTLVLAELGPGDYFGEIGIVTGAERIADVVALEPVTLLRLAKGRLRAVPVPGRRGPAGDAPHRGRTGERHRAAAPGRPRSEAVAASDVTGSEGARQQDYDAIVFGSGAGGLTCATTLAQHGLRTMLAEKNPWYGGYAHGFGKDGFYWDHGGHIFLAYRLGKQAREVFQRLKLDERVEMVADQHDYRCVFPDESMELPAEMSAAADVMAQRFPKERDGIARLFLTMERMIDEVDVFVPAFRVAGPPGRAQVGRSTLRAVPAAAARSRRGEAGGRGADARPRVAQVPESDLPGACSTSIWRIRS